MEEKKLNKPVRSFTLISITIPLFIEMLLLMLMGNIDVFMLTMYCENAVAAVGVSNQFINFAIVMFGFVSAGAAVVVAQYLGANKRKESKKVVGVAIYCSLAFGFVISLVFLFARDILLLPMTLYDDMVQSANTFLFWVGGFIFLQAALTTVNAMLRSYGYTKDTLLVTLIMNILGLTGNAIVLFGFFGFPVLGVSGVAIATCVSRGIALIIALYMLFKRVGNVFEGIRLANFPKEYAKKIMAIGVPAAGENLAFSGYQLFITSIVTGISAVALSTHVYTRTLGFFMVLITFSMAQGGQIIIGHLMGGKEYDEIYRRCFLYAKIGVVASGISALVFFLLSAPLLGIFTDNPEIIALGRMVFGLHIILEMGRALNIVIIGSLRAVGDVRFPVIVGIFSMWGIGALFAFIFAVVFEMGLVGIVIGAALDECVRGVIMIFRWKSRKWVSMGVE